MALSFCGITTNEQGKELAVHGTSPFPIACYYDDIAREEVPWHWHEELEAVVMVEGEAVITAGAGKYRLRQGEGIFIKGGILHGVWRGDTQACKLRSIVFHPRLVGSLDSIFWQKYMQPLTESQALESVLLQEHIPWQKQAMSAMEAAWEACLSEEDGYEFQVREAVSRLIFLLYCHRPSNPAVPAGKALRYGERIKVMLQYIQEHYAQEITIEQVAASAAVSGSECLRCFRSTIGITPIQYVKQYRIQKAAQLLVTTSLKIADIGTQCGFQEMSYFARTFRELRGCTPSQYREANQAELNDYDKKS